MTTPLDRFKFSAQDVRAIVTDPLGSAKAYATAGLAALTAAGVDFPDSVDTAFTELIVALAAFVVAWLVPNVNRATRVADKYGLDVSWNPTLPPDPFRDER